MENKMENKNIALILTAPEKQKKEVKKLEPQKEKQYGLPKGFKLIGFDIEV